jgi:hypothetical protein
MHESQLNTDNKNLGELFLIVASGICVEGPEIQICEFAATRKYFAEGAEGLDRK